jgi:PAS domain S-box-containing protein
MSGKDSTQVLNAASSVQPELPLDLYRAIFTHSSEPIAIIDRQGTYLEQNAAHAELLGYSDDELKNQTPAIHLGEKAFAEVARQLAETGEYRSEVVSRTKTGQVKHIELVAFTMRSNSGEPIYVGIKRDITERKRVERALLRNEAQLTDFFENSAVGLHWLGPDGTVLRVNQAELDMLGYTREEYEGHHISEFHFDQKRIADILARLREGEVLQDYEARLRCKDGGIKYVRIYSSVYREDEKFIHTRCFTRDITERKRSESRLLLQYAITKILAESRDFVESVPSILRCFCESLDWEVGALWRVDRQTETMRCVDLYHATSMKTPEFDRLTQRIAFKKGTGLPGRVWELGKPTWINNVSADDNFPRATVATREGLRGAFGFPILLGGEVGGAIEFFSPEIREPDEELLRLVGGIGAQIGQFTQRRRAEEDRAELLARERAARADAEKANRLKDEFLATLSHELRTPLNAVIGWTRMLGSGRLDRESSKHALEVIERNAWAQKQIIEDILDVSRVITGKLQLNLSPVDLVAVVDAALDAVRPAMEAKEIQIETLIDASLRMVSGDVDRLQQVVWNILSNAAKFTPQGGKVEISVSQSPTHVQIQVKDTGPGIDAAFFPYVFERFRQADGSTTRTHGGLGLGLAIVRHLVELHGGTIAVDNREHRSGAIFTIRLPLPSGELRPETLAAAEPSAKESQSEPASLEGLEVLVVDDETDALDLITVELARHGANVTGVTNATDALKALEERRFDLLVSDIAMPEIDGYELIRRIRKLELGKDKRIPAVALTAYARVQDRMQAIVAGYSTHIAKPVDANELVTIVASLAGRLGKNYRGRGNESD